MHATHSNTQYKKMNLAQWNGPSETKPNPENCCLFICVCIALCTIVAHNIAQNRPDSFPPYPQDNHHISDDVYLREGGSVSTSLTTERTVRSSAGSRTCQATTGACCTQFHRLYFSWTDCLLDKMSRTLQSMFFYFAHTPANVIQYGQVT